MTDLQLAMIGVGVALVGGVAIFNVVQERRARKRAERAFGDAPRDDALFQEARREPTIGRLPEDEAAPILPPAEPVEPEAVDLEAGVAPTASISSRIDTVAVILADDPVTREQLGPLVDSLRGHATPVHIEGIVEEQWHPVDSSPKGSWRELRVALQLASRAGPVPEEEIDEFNRAVADFAGGMNAVSQREAPAAAAQRARELDRFCAESDIEVAVNVIGQFGATFALSRVKALALDAGLSESADGKLARYGRDGTVEFTVRRFADDPVNPPTSYTHGLTFAIDVPHVADTAEAFAGMVHMAQEMAEKLGGQLVDDNRRVLSEPGLASIRRTVEKVCADMDSHGIPAGGALARRLFA